MQRLGGAAIHMQLGNDSVKYLVGSANMEMKCLTLPPYSPIACDFLNSLSIELLADKDAKKYSDIVSFAFWCRKGNMEKLKAEHNDKNVRLGRGMTFHITPSNVPINFAFSFAFSLLAGNGNIVRVPSKDFMQIGIVCRAISNLLRIDKYKKIGNMTAFVKYNHNNEITSKISSKCAARIIWGGDATINAIRKFPIPERSVDVAFADRYSFCVMGADKINSAEANEINRLAEGFYNDTYLMDQNACSSPKLLIWLGNDKDIKIAKRIFWEAVYKIVARKYKLKPVFAVDKYEMLCKNAIDYEFVNNYERYENYIYCINLNKLPQDMDDLRGKCGYFYEYDTIDVNNVAHIINSKYQTLTYFGLDKSQLVDFVLSNSLCGIDRIVPIGSALDISVIWDGYDLIGTLSRVIEVK